MTTAVLLLFRFYGAAAALTVLQTPPVRKHRTPLASEGNQTCPTPQSILSTKRLKLSTETSEEPHGVAGALMLDGKSSHLFCELVIESSYSFEEFSVELWHKFAFDYNTYGVYSFVVQIFNKLVVISFGNILARIVLRK